MTTRILIIDDEPRWINFAEDDLSTIFEVEVATSWEMALAKLKQNRYDLVIASSRWGHVLEVIRKEYPEERVVVVTSQPTTREAITMYRLGALDYFAKDFRESIVSKKIQETIQKPVKN